MATKTEQTSALTSAGAWTYRHALPVRIMHWTNVVCFVILLMSGLGIFNAHPSLDWGKSSYTGRDSILVITTVEEPDGNLIGVIKLFGHQFETTGVLGLSMNEKDQWARRAFPSWATIPSPSWLGMSRHWHFFFAWVFVINGLLYVTYSLASRHLNRDLAPTPKDWQSIGQSIKDHIRFRHPAGEAARHYNVLQKLAYLLVIFVLLPLVIFMGWAMSPWLNSLIPGWVDIFGGRQAARSIHFIVAWVLVAFVCVHVFEVIVSGFWNHIRSMITGRYWIKY
jgi:thiosulfate reductase cytochrome b subunit